MIRLELDEPTLQRVRVAASPLWETLSSLALLARYRGDAPFPYTSWARTARKTVPASMCDELSGWMHGLRPLSIPSFLAPLPASSWPDLECELDTLRSTPESIISKTLRKEYPTGVPESIRRTVGTEKSLRRFADLLDGYWRYAIAPYSSMMRNALEQEILYRGRKLAMDGPSAMLSDLGGRVRWEQPTLEAPYQLDLHAKLTEGQLYIVPVLFAGGMRLFSDDGNGVTAISYQARGAAVLDQGETSRPASAAPTRDRLATLIGKGRAAVIRSLVVPSTTTVIAQTLGLAPSTVSQHLTALVAAGVVRRSRSGYRVLYELDRGGFVLLEQMESSSRASTSA